MSTLVLAAALLAADAALSMGEWLSWGELTPRSIALELVAAVLLLASARRWAPKFQSSIGWLLAAFLCAGMALRLTDLAVRFLFSRFFDFYDLRFVPLILDMQRQSQSLLTLVAAGLATAAAVYLVVWLVRLLLRAAAGAVLQGRWRAFALAAVPALVGAVAGWPHDEDWALFSWKIGGTVTRVAGEAINIEATRKTRLVEIAAAEARRPPSVPFGALAGRDVMVVFIESYGAVSYGDPAIARVVDPARDALAGHAAAAGWDLVTGIVNSPITGGGSWMGHGSLQTGLRIADQGFYNLVLDSRAQTLTRYFGGAGWRTVSVMPRMHGHWPEGAFFGFDTHLDDAALGWTGPRYVIDTIPDQAVLDQVARRELEPDRTRPTFLQIVLASSHSPFDLVPPVLADWKAAGDGSGYAAGDGRRFPIRAGRLLEQDQGFAAAIAYDLEVVGRWLAERVPGDGLVILVGDHQPPLSSAAGSRDRGVAMHVLSRDSALLAPFRKAGFAEGTRPDMAAARMGLEDFLDFFIAAYGSDPARLQSRAPDADGPGLTPASVR